MIEQLGNAVAQEGVKEVSTSPAAMEKLGAGQKSFEPEFNRSVDFSKKPTDIGKEVNKEGLENKSSLLEQCKEKPVLSEGELNRSVDYAQQIESINNNPETMYSRCPLENGQWDGVRGESLWRPDKEYCPEKFNDDGRSWGEILNEHNIDGVPFRNGEADFSEVAKATVKLDAPTSDRGMLFAEADVKLAKERGGYPGEVTAWRKENGFTWHELRDCQTTQLVPNIIHGNVSHSGGHSVAKQLFNLN